MNKQTQTIIAIVGGVALIGYLARKQVADAAEAVSNINEGTPFEGFGVVGTLGNATDNLSGGFFSRIGNAIARVLDPNENKTIDELTGN